MNIIHRFKHLFRNKRHAFTLAEVLIVLCIMSLLAAGVIPTTAALVKKLKQQEIESILNYSWQLATTLANLRNEPMYWEMTTQNNLGHITVYSFKNDEVWSTNISAENLNIVSNSGEIKPIMRIVHGLHGAWDGTQISWKCNNQQTTLLLKSDLMSIADENNRQGTAP